MAKKQTVLFIDAGHGGLDPMTKQYLTAEPNNMCSLSLKAVCENDNWGIDFSLNERCTIFANSGNIISTLII
jgi:N-acetylmuramoyl-L-alanine amidase